MTEGFQLDAAGPAAHERYLVPAFFAPCADELLSNAPLAGPLGDADSTTLTALTADLELAMEPFVDDLGVALPMQTWLILAHQ